MIDLNSKQISELIISTKKLLIEENDLEESDLRNTKDVEQFLAKVCPLAKSLKDFFHEFTSLSSIFEKDFIPYDIFINVDNLIETGLLEQYLFPEALKGKFTDDEGNFVENKLIESIEEVQSWMKSTLTHHEQSKDEIRKVFEVDSFPKLNLSTLKCLCMDCQSEFRSKLRDQIEKRGKNLIQERIDEIESNVDEGLILFENFYSAINKSLEKLVNQFKKDLRKSTLTKLESNLKQSFRSAIVFPSELASKHCENLKIEFVKNLRSQGLRGDLISQKEFERYFLQLKTNIWRDERYHEREFKKLVQSVMLLKRKDISGNILKEYLGEFWIHSNARRINRRIIYHCGPTNSGKTYHAIEALCKSQKGSYLAPLRLLASELYDTMNSKGVKTTLLTGEEVVETQGATHYSSTIEMAKLQDHFDCCVIDEIQMIRDPQRGWAWTRALVNLQADEIHLCGDKSVLDLVKIICDLCGDKLEVKEYERMTELIVERSPILLKSLKKNDALIVFSRRNALKYKRELEGLGFKVSIVYGRLSPEVRREQARKFDIGETDIIVSTDAIAMGMNLPIKRIVFSTLLKYIDSKEFRISDSEIKQIAGRAGRFNRFPIGHVTCLEREESGLVDIKKALETILEQSEHAMVGPDLEIYNQVNSALKTNGLPLLKLSEFLRLFNTMTFKNPFFCVELKEMIELAEMVEEADEKEILSSSEIFGFSCAPVNLGLIDHVEYFHSILTYYVQGMAIEFPKIDAKSKDIDYLETSIKCTELYQWLARHFQNKNFVFTEVELLENKGNAIEKLNELLSKKMVPTCSSCGVELPVKFNFNICEECFNLKRFSFKRKIRPGHIHKATHGNKKKSTRRGKGRKFSGPRK
ncbi:MAG: hypothetical protein H6622_10670 [Halobacteriovoraceae bacterium]|nr:hypothetical protein [Halobacteriovoraceae bacterium]